MTQIPRVPRFNLSMHFSCNSSFLTDMKLTSIVANSLDHCSCTPQIQCIQNAYVVLADVETVGNGYNPGWAIAFGESNPFLLQSLTASRLGVGIW